MFCIGSRGWLKFTLQFRNLDLNDSSQILYYLDYFGCIIILGLLVLSVQQLTNYYGVVVGENNHYYHFMFPLGASVLLSLFESTTFHCSIT